MKSSDLCSVLFLICSTWFSPVLVTCNTHNGFLQLLNASHLCPDVSSEPLTWGTSCSVRTLSQCWPRQSVLCVRSTSSTTVSLRSTGACTCVLTERKFSPASLTKSSARPSPSPGTMPLPSVWQKYTNSWKLQDKTVQAIISLATRWQHSRQRRTAGVRNSTAPARQMSSANQQTSTFPMRLGHIPTVSPASVSPVIIWCHPSVMSISLRWHQMSALLTTAVTAVVCLKRVQWIMVHLVGGYLPILPSSPTTCTPPSRLLDTPPSGVWPWPTSQHSCTWAGVDWGWLTRRRLGWKRSLNTCTPPVSARLTWGHTPASNRQPRFRLPHRCRTPSSTCTMGVCRKCRQTSTRCRRTRTHHYWKAAVRSGFSACCVGYSCLPSATWRVTSMPCTRRHAFTRARRARRCITHQVPCAYTSCATTGRVPRNTSVNTAGSSSYCLSNYASISWRCTTPVAVAVQTPTAQPMMLHHITWYNTTRHHATLRRMIWQHMIWHQTAWRHTMLTHRHWLTVAPLNKLCFLVTSSMIESGHMTGSGHMTESGHSAVATTSSALLVVAEASDRLLL